MGRWLIIFGVVLIVAGVTWTLLEKLGLGRLPGDIVVERENFRLYIPLMTSDHQRGALVHPVAAEPVRGRAGRTISGSRPSSRNR